MSKLFYQTRLERPELDRAEGIYMWDKSGKRYIDGSSGAMVSNIGHSNPAVLHAMQKQMQKSTFGYRLHFQCDVAEQLAEMTAALCPEGLDRVFFVSGGSEAVESSIKLARQFALANGNSRKYKIISRTPSYHGSTFGALALTGYTPMTSAFEPMMRSMPKIMAPRAYLDGYDPNDENTGLLYARLLEDCILKNGPETVLAFIVEPIGGASTGALVPPKGYMSEIRRICDEYDVLLIHDEVMTGAGRTGTFLGADHWGIKPDILALSKGFGCGYVPLGAIVARDDIVDSVLDNGGFVHGYTYSANPLACATGVAVLNEIEQKRLSSNAARQGNYLIDKLHGLMRKHHLIGDVRGKGLLTAFELMSDRKSKTPIPAAKNAYTRLVNIAYENGLIIYSRRTRDGIEGDHFLVCPPLIVTHEQIDEMVELLDMSIMEFTATL
jgi:adenosylmethionine-8-amino-7-oxononanoate aminotransferase